MYECQRDEIQTADKLEVNGILHQSQFVRHNKMEDFESFVQSSDLKTNLAALGKAIPAIEKGMGGFLQTSAAFVP